MLKVILKSLLPLGVALLFLSVLLRAEPRPMGASAVQPGPVEHPSFRVRVVGQGQPLLLLAGLGCSGSVWDQVVARYAGQYQCHVISLAGWAGQAPVAGALLPAARQELLAYVQQHQLRRPVLLGHSLGGWLALDVAAAAPAQFSQVIVLDALPFGAAAAQPALTETQIRQAMPSPEAFGQQLAALPAAQFAQLQRQLLQPAVTDTARLRQLVAERLTADPAALGRAMAEMLQTDLRPRLSGLTLPVRVLGSEASARQLLQQPTASAAACRALYAGQYAGLPHLTLAMHPTARHFLPYDAPEWVAAQLDEVLRPAPAARR